jgi:hypothetical protein
MRASAAFPSLLFAVVLYAIVGVFAQLGGDVAAGLNQAPVSLPTPAGALAPNWADIILFFGLIALFVEIIKATATNTVAIINHALSIAVLTLCIALFLLVPLFVTPCFLLLTMMSLVDTVAGFTITIISARRDVVFDKPH